MISIYHVIEFVIEFTNPVDLFDVIYQLKIQTRNDFIANTTKIVVCRLYSNKTYGLPTNDISNRFVNSEFIAKYGNIWLKERIVYVDFERRFLDNKKNYEEDYFDLNNNLEDFEEYYNNIITISNELEKTCDKLQLTESEFNLIDSIKKIPNLKENICFIGWKDFWLTV
jgi:hypothetical protein